MAVSGETFFDAYVDIGGIRLPQHMCGAANTHPETFAEDPRRLRNLCSSRDWVDVTFDINVDLDPALFSTPPSGVTDPLAWRRWLRR